MNLINHHLKKIASYFKNLQQAGEGSLQSLLIVHSGVKPISFYLKKKNASPAPIMLIPGYL